MRAFGFRWILRPPFQSCVLFFFFFGPHLLTLGGQILLLWTVNTLFTHCADTVHTLKNIKNGSYGTIYTFKNYFAIVFSVFSFQFSVSATISLIQTDPYLRLLIPRGSEELCFLFVLPFLFCLIIVIWFLEVFTPLVHFLCTWAKFFIF